MNSRTLIGALALAAMVDMAGATTGCAGRSGTSEADLPPVGDVYSVGLTADTTSDLPRCTSALAGNVAFVANPPGLWTCADGHWSSIPCTVHNAGAVAYASTSQSLWACVASRWTPIHLPAGAAGEAGPPGAPGAPGSQVQLTPEPPGPNCAAGGQRIDVGAFVDGGFVSEQTAYVCNGTSEAPDGGLGPTVLVDNQSSPSGEIALSTGLPAGTVAGFWYSYSDVAASASALTPPGGAWAFTPVAPPPGATVPQAACLSSPAWLGYAAGEGFSFAVNATGGVPYDASGYQGVTFWAKSVGATPPPTIKVSFPDDQTSGSDPTAACQAATGACNDDFARQAQSLGTDWQQVTIPFGTLKQAGYGGPAGTFASWDGKHALNINFQVNGFGPTGAINPAFGFCVADIQLYGAAPSPAQVTVDTQALGAAIGANQLGTNMAAWFDVTQPGVASEVAGLGVHLLRWPGGSASDTYHWATHTTCNGQYVSPNSTFANFMNDIVIPGNFEVAVTLNYGSNATCDGGGDPAEAAAWVQNVVANGYNVHHYTVGNEEYGSWEYDLHTLPHDPATYAAAVGGPNGYYALIKAQDPTAQVGVLVLGGPAWDATVLGSAPYDFVELHNYTAQQPNGESDSYLLNAAAPGLTTAVAGVRAELAAAGRPDVPIMLGEFNSVPYNPGKQTTSIVNGLYAGMAFGELLNDGVALSTWFMGTGQGCSTNNDDSSLYGWQSVGTYDQIANACPGVPDGSVFPAGRAAQLLSQFAVPGNQMLAASVGSSTTVRAYAATQGPGFAVWLFNVDAGVPAPVVVNLANASRTAFTASTTTYGKAQYDDSRPPPAGPGVWTAPVTQSMGPVGTSIGLTLPPWSMTVLTAQ